MPIKIPNKLPAVQTLADENIFVMTQTRATTQDIRPLQLLILNLMPTKIETETQLSRLLGNTPLQIEVEFMHTRSHRAKNVSQDHLFSFYRTFDEIKNNKYDGMIITGAPVEKLEFEQVDYWDELCTVMEWSKTNVHSTLHICWGAQAGLYYHYGINKHMLDRKLFGVFEHVAQDKHSMLLRGFDDVFFAPHSRYTGVAREDIEADSRLKILASSDRAGVYAVKNENGSRIFVFGHSEYDADTLEREYKRDRDAGIATAMPENYYPDDDDSRAPRVCWRAHANLLFSNWLNYFVYQTTPYDISQINDK